MLAKIPPRPFAPSLVFGFEDIPLIDGYRVARNCLAHDGGIVRKQLDRSRISALPHVQVDESRLLMAQPTVHLLPGACESAVETATAFFDRLSAICQLDPRAKTSRGQ
jgi:hypothetical protein